MALALAITRPLQGPFEVFVPKQGLSDKLPSQGERAGGIATTAKGSEGKLIHSEKLTRMLTARAGAI